MRLFWEYYPADMDVREFCTQLVLGTLDRLTVIDELLSEASENWSLNRMSVVDRNILRLATYELVDRPDIPPSVSINEAIEIAKRYGADEAPRFVNGVLDAITKE